MSDINNLFIHRHLRRFCRSAVRPGTGRLLDLGCGARPYRELYEGLYPVVVGADCSLLSSADVLMDAHMLPFGEKTYDIVIMTELIEHMKHPSAALSEVSRVIRAGGYLFLSWPFCYSIHDLPNDFTRFTEFGMAELLRESGFEMVEINRRGDLICVLAAIVGHGTLGAAEWLRRIPGIGIALQPLAWAIRRLVDLLYLMAFSLTKSAERIQPKDVGEGLKRSGQLALWTLGYCAVARRVRG
jgi:SAM-dependent methyltransferase